MITEIKNVADYKELCKKNWNEIAQFWIESRKLPKLLESFILNRILNSTNQPSILDIGCGNAWLYKEIVGSNPDFEFEYLGLDVSEIFISRSRDDVSDKKAKFIVADFEEELIDVEKNSIDLAIAVLSFIEMVDLNAAFRNIHRILKKSSSCGIVVLDPFLELVRLNSDIDMLKTDILKFRGDQKYYYRKKIVIDSCEKEIHYYGLLHHIDNYFEAGIRNGLQLSYIKEIDAINELGPDSTVYFYMEYIKP